MAPDERARPALTDSQAIGALALALHSQQCEECRRRYIEILNHLDPEAAGGA